MFLVVYLAHGIFNPGAIMFFSKSVFAEERPYAAKLRNLTNKAVHLCRSTRQGKACRKRVPINHRPRNSQASWAGKSSHHRGGSLCHSAKTWLLSPRSLESRPCFAILFVVYLGHEITHRAARSFYIITQRSGEGPGLFKWGDLKHKKGFAPLNVILSQRYGTVFPDQRYGTVFLDQRYGRGGTLSFPAGFTEGFTAGFEPVA